MASLALSSSEGFTCLDSPNRQMITPPLHATQQDSRGFVDCPQSRSEQLFAKFPLFEDILRENKDLIAKLGPELETVTVSGNEVVVDIGDEWDSTYFLIEGALGCTGCTEEKAFLPGDSFGEVSLVSNSQVSGLRVTGLAPTSTLLRLRGEVFDRLVDDGTFSILLLKYLKNKLTSKPASFILSATAARTVAAGLAGASPGGHENIFSLSSSTQLDPRLYLDGGLEAGHCSLLQMALPSIPDLLSMAPSPEQSLHTAAALGCAHLWRKYISDDSR